MANTPIKDSYAAQIDTLLASGKSSKISPLDYRTVATNTIQYIDNRILTVGAITLSNWAARDNGWYIPFTSPVATDNYIVIGSPSTAIGDGAMCRTHMTLRSRSTAGFYLVGATKDYWNIGGVTVLYEYIIIAVNEQGVV